MASKADGTIYINTAIETDGFTAGGKEVEAAARRMAKSVSGIGASAKIALQKQTDAFVKQNQLFSQQEQKVEELKQKQEEIASQKNETAEYKNLSSEMEKLDSEMDAVIQKQKDLISTGFSEDEAYRTVEDDLERIGSAIDRIIEKQKQMRESGTAYQTPDTSAIDQKVFAAELKLEQMHTALGTSYESLTQKAQKYEEQAMEAAAKAQAAERKNEERLANMNRKLEETRAKEVQAIVEAERLKEIGKNAEISDQHIVDLNKELTQLKARQEELSRAGLSFGYEEFDQISVRVAEIMQALKEYEDALNNTKKQSFDFSSAQDKLKKAMSGLTSSVKKITLSLIGLSGSTKKANGSLGSSLKTIIKYSLGIRGLCALFDKIRNAATDGFSNLAQYSGATNASISSLISALTQLKNSFATAFAPVLNVVAPILTTFINMVSRAVTYVGMLIGALSGQSSFTKAIGVQEDYAASVGKTASAAKDAADATKEADKANNDYLSGLDEINRYSKTDKSTSGTNNADVGYKSPTASEMFETVPIENSISGLADKIKNLIQSEDWEGLGGLIADGLNKGMAKVKNAISWDNIGPTVTYFVNAFTRSFNSLVDNLDWDLLGKTIGTGVNTIVNTLNLLITGINWINLGTKFATGLMGLIDEINWTNLGNLIGNKFMVAWQIFYGFVSNLDYTAIGLKLADLINSAILSIDLGLMFSAFSQFALGILNSVSIAIQNTDWTAVGQQIADAIRAVDWFGIASGLFDVGLQLVSGLLQAFGQLPAPVQAAATALAGLFVAAKGFTIFEKVTDAISAAGGLIPALQSLVGVLSNPVVLAIAAVIAAGVLIIANWDKIANAAGKLKDWVVDKINTLKTNVVNTFSTLATNVEKFWNTNIKGSFTKFDQFLSGVFSKDWTKEFGVFGNILNAFFKNVSNIWDSIKTVFNGIITFITGVFSGNWKKAWEGIKSVFAGIWKGLMTVVKSPINGIIGALNSIVGIVNSLISRINSISFTITVPSWVPGFGGSSWGFNGFNIPSIRTIPYLATGAVIPPNAPFMAVLGDQKRGTNIETPEALLRKIVREEAGQKKQNDASYHFTAQLNRRTIFDEIITEAKLRQSSSGRNPFELA